MNNEIIMNMRSKLILMLPISTDGRDVNFVPTLNQ